MFRIWFYILFFLSLTIYSCGPGSPGDTTGTVLPNVTGAAGEVLIVMDQDRWASEPGILLKEILEREFPALPQREPLFDIIHISHGAFDDMFKRYRTIIIVTVSSEIEDPDIRFLENQWAKPQLVVNIRASNNESLAEFISGSAEKLLYNLQSYDRKRLIEIFESSKDSEIKSIVSKFFIELAIPRGYKIDISQEDFAMFSIESPRSSQVVFIYQNPYSGEKDISTARLIENRNEILKKYTRGSQIGSYVTTSPGFPPIAYDLMKNGNRVVEIRGWWELNKGFMGGPFISHTLVDERNKRSVTVEAYVYNPQDKKRNLMRHMEAIVYSAKFIER